MNQKTSDIDEVNEGSRLTVVTVPLEHTQAVIDFVAGLESEDSEVSGHMISGGAFGGLGGMTRSIKHRTDTGCVQTKTGVGVDFNCSDSDTETS